MSREGSSPQCSPFRSPLVLVALSFAAGIALADTITPPLVHCYVLFALSLLLWVCRENTATFLILIFVSGGLLHLVKTNAQKSAPFFDQLSDGPIHVTVEGVIVSPPEHADNPAGRTRFDFQLDNVTRNNLKIPAFVSQHKMDPTKSKILCYQLYALSLQLLLNFL